MKNCEQCGVSLVGMKDYARRRFCSMKCYGLSITVTPTTPERGRYQAQYRFAATSCNRCGASTKLERHHKDENPMNNSPENIEILCRKCHVAHHRPFVQPTPTCKVCAKVFEAPRWRNSICSAQCAQEWGRINALKRWAGQELDDCVPTETQLTQKPPKLS